MKRCKGCASGANHPNERMWRQRADILATIDCLDEEIRVHGRDRAGIQGCRHADRVSTSIQCRGAVTARVRVRGSRNCCQCLRRSGEVAASSTLFACRKSVAVCVNAACRLWQLSAKILSAALVVNRQEHYYTPVRDTSLAACRESLLLPMC